MFPSLRLGLVALLRGIKSIGYTLKSFVLRCLLFRPHILRSFRRIWSLCSGTSPKDVSKKKGGNARPSFPGASGGCEGYTPIWASRVSGRPHSQLGPGSAENVLLSPMTAQSQSAPHSPASMHAPLLHGSPQLSNRQLSASSASIAGSHNAESRPPSIRYLDAPLTSTHSRVTSTQFGPPSSGRQSRSRSRSRHPHRSSTPGTRTASPVESRTPSLRSYPDPQLQPLPRSSSPGSTQTPHAEPTLQDTSGGYHQLGLEITFSPPSRSQTADSQSPFDFPQPPLPLQPGHLSGLSHIPTPSAEHSTPNPLDLGGSGSLYLMPVPGGALLGSGGLPPTPSSNQVPSLRFHSQVSFRNTLTTDASGNWSDKKERVLRPMHSEQVSRYVNKNDVSSENGKYKLQPMEVDLPR
ncbi:hypothetical protein EDB92DRAFT_196970 [Lactarius akahatsu]|uniref:Uncharacterized protein n=1 Tax=Lactarius akahatsu TaxID=416441 RepID=A0AAD4QCN0_9AGAM|nr:hypothetical protein EDB92DRAFT_196970 [Lactarius akahatsu]